MIQRWLRRAEVARHYRVSLSTLHRRLRDGSIPPPAKRLGRVSLWDLREIERVDDSIGVTMGGRTDTLIAQALDGYRRAVQERDARKAGR